MVSDLECEGVVYLCANCLDMVLCGIFSLLFWVVLVVCNCSVLLLDLVLLVIGS